jgi:hypothetical protein
MENPMKKEIITIIKNAFEKPPPEVVAAQALYKAGYLEEDLNIVVGELEDTLVWKTRNALRDIERRI